MELIDALSAIVRRFKDLQALSDVALERFEIAAGHQVLASSVAAYVSRRMGVEDSPWWRRKLAEALAAIGVKYQKRGQRRDRYYVGLRERKK